MGNLIKLNLGSGDKPLEGYVNIDRKTGDEAYPLNSYSDNSIGEIRASHILEHFPIKDVMPVVKHWFAKLCPGGIIKIAVPDFGLIAKKYCAGENINFVGYLAGGQTNQDDFHKCIFDETVLSEVLKAAGFTDIKHWDSEVEDCASLPISLNLQGIKPKTDPDKAIKIRAVMSMPRLTFTDNLFCALRAAVVALGIDLEKGSGVFWGQVLSRMMASHLNDGTEYIITIDYDTWFLKEHLMRLLQLMQEHPEIDAIVPMQVKRENDLVMFSKADENGKPISRVPIEEFHKDVTPIVNGHFGLTIFRVSAFNQLKKPWFLPIPDSNGEWGDGRTDEDIYFWQNFSRSGLKAALAPKVNIGHLQQVATFPGKVEDEWKPIHCYLTDIEKGIYPEHCKPKVELEK